MAGSVEHFTVEVGTIDLKTTIPISVIHGIKNGPVLGITAGVHGYEYAPILAGQKLLKEIKPSQLVGTIILVQIANTGSFLGRTPFINPLDGKNLNRSFPGQEDGSITEQIANYISKKVIARSDYFVDMHSGDAPEDLFPYAAYYQNDNKEEISDKGKKMAVSMGFEHVVVFKTTGKDYMRKEFPSLYCSAEAFKQGKAAVDIECGRLGIVEEASIKKIILAVQQLLKSLKMTEGTFSLNEQIKVINERSFISSNYTGIFYPKVHSGQHVEKGSSLGYITNFFGEKIDDIYADKSGVVLLILGTPPVKKGETLCVIGDLDLKE
ncbi:hypothetical protein GCM10011506_20030 [Marivirga lumbricoides]|uniref:Succinylglutamate desuccinylase/Aspartoacylase catalytic domain-containing protein n=2 Tax=Marivirga lumbricoides TaxID=1046115 RepID=A0ABQ1M6U8_9BACT|nr:hypothetical protein GCM10011506_20030 [Marivirga lumbricoides]